MKMLLTFGLAGAIALTTSAQTAAFAQSDVNSAFDVFRLSVESRTGLAPVETPSMRDAKLARARDLKNRGRAAAAAGRWNADPGP